MKRRGNTLVSTLATIAIIAILAVVLLKGSNIFGKAESSRADGKGKTTLGLAIANSNDEVCKSNLSQVRMSLSILKDPTEEGGWPGRIEDTKIGSQFYKCPLGKEAYQYSPENGQVKCVHPGHEKY